MSLHSTVVLLKVMKSKTIDDNVVGLHSTVVLLKGARRRVVAVETQVYILL